MAQVSAIWTPAQVAIPAIASVPATPSQVLYLLNSGWDTHARSKSNIAVSNYIEFSVNAGVAGAFLGLGEKNRDGYSIGSFAHALLVDSTGVWVFESGAKVLRIKITQVRESVLRIIRQPNNEIVYMAITGDESLFAKSTVVASPLALYGYGYLYSSGDIIDAAKITAGRLQFGRA